MDSFSANPRFLANGNQTSGTEASERDMTIEEDMTIQEWPQLASLLEYVFEIRSLPFGKFMSELI